MSRPTVAVTCVLPEAAMSVLEAVGSVRLPDSEPPLPVAELHELVRGT